MSDLKISIIVPCYNAEEWIEECVLSIVNQTYKNKEIIIIDNESTDGSYKKIADLKEKYPELIVDTASNIYPCGWTEPVEKALEYATGDYFTIVGADDYLDHEYVGLVVSKIKKDPSIVCLQSAIDRRVMNSSEGAYSISPVVYYYTSLEEQKNQLLIHCCVNTPSVFYKKDLYTEGLLEWDSENYSGAADYELYCRLSDKGIMITPFRERFGYTYRVHSGQSTWRMVEMQLRGDNFDTKIKNKWSMEWSAYERQ